VLLACSALAAATSVSAALLAITALHHLYFDRRNLPDLEAFAPLEFPTIGHIYDANGQPLIELAREYRQITQYTDIPPIVRDAIRAAEDKHFFSHNGVDYFCIPCSARSGSAHS
jgi:penicillin-binding protein 1A